MDAMEVRALIQRESGDYAAAAKTYEDMIKKVNDAIDKVKKNTEASKEVKEAFIKQFSEDVTDYRYILSGLYIDAKDVDKATDELKTLLKEEPDNPSYNNDLGYIWADHDMNLAEAEKLIRKAIEDDKKEQTQEEPRPEAGARSRTTPSYLDSLGWVLFKEKKYKEALPPLQEAVKEEEGAEHRDLRPPRRGPPGARATRPPPSPPGRRGWKPGRSDWKKSAPANANEEKKAEVEKKSRANQ